MAFLPEKIANTPTPGVIATWATLTAGVNASATTLALSTAWPNHSRLLIGTEWMRVTAGFGTSTVTVERGVEGSTAALHALGAAVTGVETAEMHRNNPGGMTAPAQLNTLDADGNVVPIAITALPFLTSDQAAAAYQPIGTYLTPSSTSTLTNKSGAISQWTNDAGYLTSAPGAAWGGITGTLSAQTDLQAALDAKLGVVTLQHTAFGAQGAVDISYIYDFPIVVNVVEAPVSAVANVNGFTGVSSLMQYGALDGTIDEYSNINAGSFEVVSDNAFSDHTHPLGAVQAFYAAATLNSSSTARQVQGGTLNGNLYSGTITGGLVGGFIETAQNAGEVQGTTTAAHCYVYIEGGVATGRVSVVRAMADLYGGTLTGGYAAFYAKQPTVVGATIGDMYGLLIDDIASLSVVGTKRAIDYGAGKFYVDSAGGVHSLSTIAGSNLSGTNTGDQDLSPYALTSALSAYLTSVAAAAGYQPLDADLTAIAALSGTGGWAKRTASNTWSISTPTASDVGLGNVDNTSDAAKNAAAVSLTNKKLGSLTGNGFVKTSGGDGTLSVDTSSYLTSVTAHNLLSATHGDTTAASVARGAIITGQGASPAWALLAKPSVLSNLSHDGTDVSWVTAVGTGAPVRAIAPALTGTATAVNLTLSGTLLAASDGQALGGSSSGRFAMVAYSIASSGTPSAGEFSWNAGTSKVRISSGLMQLGSVFQVQWSAGDPGSVACDVSLARDGSARLGQRSGTTAQRSSTYNTFTTVDTAYESFEIDWQAVANRCVLTTRKGSVSGTLRGMTLGESASVPLSLYGVTPVVQPTTAIAAATFVANTSLIANDTATFDGYTIGQVVKALRNTGLLA